MQKYVETISGLVSMKDYFNIRFYTPTNSLDFIFLNKIFHHYKHINNYNHVCGSHVFVNLTSIIQILHSNYIFTTVLCSRYIIIHAKFKSKLCTEGLRINHINLFPFGTIFIVSVILTRPRR